MSTSAGLETAAAKESHAKAVLSECDSLRLKLFAKSMSLTSLRVSKSKEPDTLMNAASAKTEKRFQALRALVHSDGKGREAVEAYLATMKHLNAMIDEAQKKYIDGVFTGEFEFSSFLSEQDLFEEVSVYSKRVTEDIDRINEIYAPIVAEFRPEAAKRRDRLRALVYAGVGANILLSLALALYFGRNTVSRLETLMRKLKDFSTGKNDLPPIKGSDEVAELDTAFRQMALERAQADELKKAVQAMVSHDLRSPLTSILLRLQLCQSGVYGEVQPPLQKTFETIEAEIQRLVRLANDLLDAEKLESGKLELQPEFCDAESFVLEAVQAVSVLAEMKQITIEVAKVDPRQEISCDRGRIIQVLINFLSNAVKFSPRSTKITVSVKRTTSADAVRFEVVDQGRGLSEDERQRVFDKFVQLQQSAEVKSTGTGLGLAICKQLVELHGGRLGADSPPAGGSCFWFELPG
ncbi:MAG: HAMP domain-containing histidine kinase [Candidatus Obscuribacterales bacterium]|nr:HAMP domain-containing histidine kinase [Candidatus Obscuribacterales bacterium]